MIHLVPAATRAHRGGLTAYLRHFGAFGLFFLAILDSSPIPTFGGPDILVAILAASRRNPWFEYAIVATAGSALGAYFTFRLARRSGMGNLASRFDRGHKQGHLSALLKIFDRWGTAALAVSTAVPLPFPTSVFFAAAGASGYSARRFIVIVALCRGARYSLIAILAEHYRRHFIRMLRHPGQEWHWLLFFAILVTLFVIAGAIINRKLQPAPETQSPEFADESQAQL